jgi:outer membrane autotransporter protein
VRIASGADVSGLTLLDGGDDLTAADGFIDVLSVDGLSGAVDGSIIRNWEEINVANSNVQVANLVAGAVTVTASTVVATNLTADKVSLTNSTTTIGGTSVVATVNTCGGSTTLTGSTATTDVKGCASADTIVISGDAVIANAIEGAGGADTISVLGNASVASVNGAGAGSDGSAAADAGNTILVNTTGTVGTVLGGDQADAITLTAGTVGPVLAGGGADVIAAGGAAIASIDAGAGNDTATWSAGAVGSVAMGNGSDALVVSAATYDGSQVLDGGDDLSSADGMVDTLTLKNLTVAATGAKILNMENVVIDGGRVSFSDNALTTGSDAGTGLSIVNGGALDAGDAFALTGNLTVNAGSTFDGTGAGAGVYSISGNLANNGLVTTKDGVVGDTITVAGNYSGTGVLSVDINTATDTIDTLVIAGDVTGGPTTVVVNNLSPLGASGNALTVIAVGGTSAAGDFVLDGGSLTAGAFDYNLAHQGSNFVLASAVNSTGAVYQAVPMVMNGFFNNLPTLEQRVGQRQWAGTNVARGELQPSTGGWLRQRGDGLKASTTTGIATKSNSWGLQAGIDYDVEAGGDGLWVLGVTGQYGKLNSSVTNALGSGSIDAEGFDLGATATWYGTKGTYVDLQAQANWISSDMSSSAAGTLASGELSKAYALSAEVGHRFELNQNTTLVPQAQLTLGKLHGASFTDSAGNAVDLGNNNSTVGRLGLAYEYENNDRTDGNRAKAYVIGNILHDFSTDSTVRVAGADLSTSASGATWGEIGLGGSVTVDANKTTVYGEASYRGAFNGGSNSGLGLTAGLRVQW